MLVGEYPGKIIKFAFEGNAVGIAVAAGPDAGIIEYSIDDQPWQKLDLFTRWSQKPLPTLVFYPGEWLEKPEAHAANSHDR